jgi:MFS family permease
MPLLAQRSGGGAAMYTAMMSCLGAGAIVAALQFPRLRARFDRDQFVRYGTMIHAALSTLIVAVPTPWIVLPAMALLGAAWISTANTFVVAAQLALPNWVRARGMSIYQMALMGGTAIGAAFWGQVAGMTSVASAVVAAALSGVALLFLTRRWSVAWGGDEDLSPQPPRGVPGVAIDIQPGEGPVMVVIEYLIDPARAAAFADVMRATRAARLRQGALSWGLFRDTAVPGRYVEYFVDETWVEHQRRMERFTVADGELRARRLAFHLLSAPPAVRRYVAASMAAEPTLPP